MRGEIEHVLKFEYTSVENNFYSILTGIHFSFFSKYCILITKNYSNQVLNYPLRLVVHFAYPSTSSLDTVCSRMSFARDVMWHIIFCLNIGPLFWKLKHFKNSYEMVILYENEQDKSDIIDNEICM